MSRLPVGGRAEERGGPGRAGSGRAQRGPQAGGHGVAAAASQALGEPAAGGQRGAGLPVSLCGGVGCSPRSGRPGLPPGPAPLRRAQRSGPARRWPSGAGGGLVRVTQGGVGLGGPGGWVIPGVVCGQFLSSRYLWLLWLSLRDCK